MTHTDQINQDHTCFHVNLDFHVVTNWFVMEGADIHDDQPTYDDLVPLTLRGIAYYVGPATLAEPRMADIAAQIGLGLPYDNSTLEALLEPIAVRFAIDDADICIEFPNEESDALWVVARPHDDMVENSTFDNFMHRYVEIVEALHGALN